MAADRESGLHSVAIGLLLTGAVLAVYSPVTGFEFVWDDFPFLLNNEHVRGGLLAPNLAWALSSRFAANWYPLTWFSHMLDFELFGAEPAGHHVVNVLLHLLNTLLLYRLLATSTKRPGPSAALAVLFAVHPLNVETVAWVSQRKTLLSTLLGLLSILAYVGWCRRGGAARYAGSACLLALSLMAKPMFVTLPFLLLLWDFWPLGRGSPARWGGASGVGRQSSAPPRWSRLLLEKIPFFLLVALSSAITLSVQAGGGAERRLPFELRIGNAIVSYARYLAKALAPSDLSPFYGHPNLPGGTPWALHEVLGAAALLIAISSCIGLAAARRHLVVGWLWFLGTLVPTIGLVQVGNQAMADRYAYLPLVGLLLVGVFGMGEGLGRLRATRLAAPFAVTASAALVVGFGAQARAQLACWADDVTLFRRAAELQPGPSMIHYNLGRALQVRGRVEAAISELQLALAVDPDGGDIHNNLYVLLQKTGQHEAAAEHLEAGLRVDPANADLQNNMGLLLQSRGDTEGAIRHFRIALRRVRPGRGNAAQAHDNLGAALGTLGRFEEAEEHFREALELEPRFAGAHFHLGLLHAAQGQLDPAIERFRHALEIDPALEAAKSNLASALHLKNRPDRSP